MNRGMPRDLTREGARRFLLLHHGLIGPYRFVGQQGVMDFVAQAGCIQYDPIDVCGRNAELVLQSRVRGFTKPLLARLLYEERVLLDYFDKNLAIVRVEDWLNIPGLNAAARGSTAARRYAAEDKTSFRLSPSGGVWSPAGAPEPG